MKKTIYLLAMLMAGITTYGQEFSVPNVSGAAESSYTIANTNIKVVYHSPLVNKREVWGNLVPYNQGSPIPWRAGANQNTIIEFSTDVVINGQTLPKGKYGIHMIPGKKEWQFILSKDFENWGSFRYKAENDALRATVVPRKGRHQENLVYAFARLDASSVELQLRWADYIIPLSINVDLNKVVYEPALAAIEKLSGEDRGVALRQLSSYSFSNQYRLNDALGWMEESVELAPSFLSYRMLAMVKETLGQNASADWQKGYESLDLKGLMLNGETMVINGYLDQGKAVFEYALKQHPDAWQPYAGFALYYHSLSNANKAKSWIGKAPESAKDDLVDYLSKRGLSYLISP